MLEVLAGVDGQRAPRFLPWQLLTWPTGFSPGFSGIVGTPLLLLAVAALDCELDPPPDELLELLDPQAAMPTASSPVTARRRSVCD